MGINFMTDMLAFYVSAYQDALEECKKLREQNEKLETQKYILTDDDITKPDRCYECCEIVDECYYGCGGSLCRCTGSICPLCGFDNE